MIISIIGAGKIGVTLGKKWSEASHKIVFGVRDPQSLKTSTAMIKMAAKAQACDVAGAITGSDVVLFSVPWSAVPAIVSENKDLLDNKIVIDATNNFSRPEINNLRAIREAAPNASVYRAFNSLGWELFDNPVISGMQLDHFYTGPDGEYRFIVEQLIMEVGLRPIWVGDHEKIEIVDQLGALWVELAIRQGRGRSLALKLLER